MKLFMMISFFTFSYFWLLFWTNFICKVHLEDLLDYTLPYYTGDKKWHIINSLATIIAFQQTFYYNMILALNTCVCLDLVLMLWNPFRNVESRYLHYMGWSVVVSLIPSSIRVAFGGKNLYIYGYFLAGCFLAYIFIAIYSAYVAQKALNRPGMSKIARQMINRRHFTYILVNFFCQLYCIISKILLNIDATKNYENWSLWILIVLFFG